MPARLTGVAIWHPNGLRSSEKHHLKARAGTIGS
jgi:hypothetical protein